MKTAKIVVGILLFSIAITCYGQYNVGVKEAKPFAYKENGVWVGYSIEVLKKLAENSNIQYSLKEFNDLPSLLEATSNNKVDFSIAAISANLEREKLLDFSYPYFHTTQGILTQQTSSWAILLWIIPKVLIGLIIYIIMHLLVGWFIARLDVNIKNTEEGSWWSVVTFSTTGYGDIVPKTRKGRLFAASWITASMFLAAIFTGYMASTMTVKSLTQTPMTLQDLYTSHRIVTIKGNSENILLELGIKHSIVKDAEVAVEMVENGKATAFIYDEAMLSYMTLNNEDLIVWPIAQYSESYVTVFPEKSTLTETINRSILTLKGQPSMRSIGMKYFGK